MSEAEFACQTTAAPVSAAAVIGVRAASTPALWPPEEEAFATAADSGCRGSRSSTGCSDPEELVQSYGRALV